MSMIRDLITLNRRADGWNLSARLYFYRAYLAAGTGQLRLGASQAHSRTGWGG